jgi:hypothetical protein
MVVAAVAIVLVTGNPLAFVLVIGCVLMMVVMMQLMGMGGRGGDDAK